MISIKRFLDQRLHKGTGPDRDVVEALSQVGRLLVDAIAAHTVRGRETDFNLLRGALRALARQIDEAKSAMGLLSASSDVVEAMETYCLHTTEYLQAEKDQMQSMVVMLTDTVADISGQSDISVLRLQTIEKDLELASGLNDMKAVRMGLESCLRTLRDASAEQKRNSAATVQRLRDHVDRAQQRNSVEPKNAPISRADIEQLSEVPDVPVESVANSYVAGFKLKRAEHITGRFGEAATHQMLSTLGALLKVMVGPDDRLLRWKGTSYVMFINSTGTIGEIRALLAETVSKIGMQHVEVGRKSALLSVGVDWIVFPQADHASLEAVLAEVDTFLAGASPEKSTVGTRH